MPHRMHQSKRTFALLVALLSLQLYTGVSHAQASRATAYRKADLQIGGYYIYGKSDYAPERFDGLGGYITYDFKPHWGVEVNIRQINDTGVNKIYERTYEVGGRYVIRKGPFNPYARVSVGRGVFNFPQNRANLAYNLFSVGGGLDYNLIPSVNLRADYEYQNWLSFPSSGKGLTPQLISVGVAYHFH